MPTLTSTARSKRARILLATIGLAAVGAAGLAPVRADAAPFSRGFAAVSRWRIDPLSRAATDALDVLHVDGSTSPTFLAARHLVALQVASSSTATVDQFETAWTAAGDQRTGVVLAALAQVGVPYRRNMSVPGVGFDCSGLTMYAWSTVGLELPHQSERQIGVSSARSIDGALAGDLVQYPGHVMLYLGVGRVIVHAPNSGHRVEVRDLAVRRSVQVASPQP